MKISYPKSAIKFFEPFIVELLIIFTLLFTINNYIGNVDRIIASDGLGYYEYLPSTFIHKDLARKDKTFLEDSTLYRRINKLEVYVDYGAYKVNKYPVGTAVLQLPFFVYTYFRTKLEGNKNDGYQIPFQRTIFHATLFYLFFSLLFLKKLMNLYNINRITIILCQILIVFSTSVINYANLDASFSHIYSLFAITAFLYFARSYFKNRIVHHFVVACLFLGLIFILRQVNILIILFIPFLAGSWKELKYGIVEVFQYKKTLIGGIVLFIGMAMIQFTMWYLQTGNFWVYSYQGETFNFADPQIWNILFSYKKGLFVYTPVLFITLSGVVWFFFKRDYYSLTTWLIFFGLITYVLSSWWSWFYGCSYGLRAYIEYYPIFFIPFAIMIGKINNWVKYGLITLAILTIPINIIQTYQYKEFILHWIDMDKEKYWKVFLKTESQFNGLLYKKQFNLADLKIEKEILLGTHNVKRTQVGEIAKINLDEVPNFDNVRLIQMQIDNEFRSDDNSKLIITVDNSKFTHNYYWHAPSLIQFHESKLNEFQTGSYFFELPEMDNKSKKVLTIFLEANAQDRKLQNVKLRFLTNRD